MRPFENLCAGVPWIGAGLFQATLVAVLGVLAWYAVRRSGPALRSAVLLATLAGVVVVPGLGAFLPVWLPVPVLEAAAEPAPAAPSPGRLDPEAQAILVHSVTPAKSEPVASPPQQPHQEPVAPAGTPETEPARPAPTEKATVPVAPAATPGTPCCPGEPAAPWTITDWLARLWLLGALSCLLCAALRLGALYHCLRRARPLHDAELTACLAGLARDYGLTATVALR